MQIENKLKTQIKHINQKCKLHIIQTLSADYPKEGALLRQNGQLPQWLSNFLHYQKSKFYFTSNLSFHA